MGFIQLTIAIGATQPYAVFSSLVRSLSWGPSLLVWASDDTLNYSFGKWLAPGLYVEVSEKASGSEPSPDTRTLVKSFGNNDFAKYQLLSIVDAEMVMCSRVLSAVQREKQIWILAEMANFEDSDEAECAQLRSRLSQTALEKVANAFKKDGEEVFCHWVGEAMEKRSDGLWQRFLAKH